VHSSALVKLVVEEPESDPLRELLERDADQLASAIIEIEVLRAVRRAVPQLTTQAQRVVSQIAVVEPTDAIRAEAALLEPVTLRSLDALHLATALAIGGDLDGFFSYDGRLSAAAESVGLVIVAPR
jgi:predicted nucleic acid-binding protein